MREETADMTEEDATSQAARDEDEEQLEEEPDEYLLAQGDRCL
jgi:hypothetical protein